MSGIVAIYAAESWGGGVLSENDGRVPRWWQPTLLNPFFCQPFQIKLAPYTLMHWLGFFDGPEYGAVLIGKPAQAPDHVSYIFPRFARFPFMGKYDLQIGATGTRPEARGQGLALRAIREVMTRFAKPERRFWYVSDIENKASIAVIVKAGFSFVGTGQKRPRFGLAALGYYAIENEGSGL